MGVGSTCAALAAVCCFMFMPFVLQTVGFFTPMWGSNSTCDSIGLVYSCCPRSDNTTITCGNTNGGDELDVRALGLQATSFAVMFLTVFCLCCGSCCKSDNDEEVGWCQTLGGCCFGLFPVAGLFSVIGCIIVATKFSTSMLGYSFYLCLAAGCYVILVTIIVCCCACKLARNGDGGQRDVDVHDEGANTVVYYIQRINVVSIVQSYTHYE